MGVSQAATGAVVLGLYGLATGGLYCLARTGQTEAAFGLTFVVLVATDLVGSAGWALWAYDCGGVEIPWLVRLGRWIAARIIR